MLQAIEISFRIANEMINFGKIIYDCLNYLCTWAVIAQGTSGGGVWRASG